MAVPNVLRSDGLSCGEYTMRQRQLSFFGHLVNVGLVRFVDCRTPANGRIGLHAPVNSSWRKLRRYRFSRSRVMKACVQSLRGYQGLGTHGLRSENGLIESVRVLLGLLSLNMDAEDTYISTSWLMDMSPGAGLRTTLEPVDWVLWLMSNPSIMRGLWSTT